MRSIKRLKAAELYQRCDPAQVVFETTADMEDLTEVVGQPRAVEAMQFGMGIQRDGYNIFALGPSGTGKRSLVRQFFEQRAGTEPVPSDWCYVNNFEESHKPRAICLPPGKGMEFRQDMEQLVEGLRTALSAAFESEEYQTRRQVISEEFQEQQTQAFKELQQQAQEKGGALLRTPAGLAFAPMHEGEVLSPEEVQKLSQEERKRLEVEVEELQEKLQKILRQVPSWQREIQEKLKELNREMAHFAVGGLIDELCEKYTDFPKLVEHLNAVREDVVENARDFLSSEEEQPSILDILQRRAMQPSRGGSSSLRRYQVNVLVDHSKSEGAPVVYEDNPTFQNLIGRLDEIEIPVLLVR